MVLDTKFRSTKTSYLLIYKYARSYIEIPWKQQYHAHSTVYPTKMILIFMF